MSKVKFGGKPASPPVGKTLSCAHEGNFVDRNLVPLKTVAQQNQFAPTDARPVRMHFALAGGR